MFNHSHPHLLKRSTIWLLGLLLLLSLMVDEGQCAVIRSAALSPQLPERHVVTFWSPCFYLERLGVGYEADFEECTTKYANTFIKPLNKVCKSSGYQKTNPVNRRPAITLFAGHRVLAGFSDFATTSSMNDSTTVNRRRRSFAAPEIPVRLTIHLLNTLVRHQLEAGVSALQKAAEDRTMPIPNEFISLITDEKENTNNLTSALNGLFYFGGCQVWPVSIRKFEFQLTIDLSPNSTSYLDNLMEICVGLVSAFSFVLLFKWRIFPVLLNVFAWISIYSLFSCHEPNPKTIKNGDALPI